MLRSGVVHFRLWAPKPERVKLVLEAPQDGIPSVIDMKAEGNGYFSCTVTPRRGKAVELNALWYNALCLLEGWMREEQSDAFVQQLHEHAERARLSFNARFWYEERGYLYDVVDREGG